MLDALLDLILPPICLACDALIAPGDAARLICRRCRTRLRTPPPPVCQRCGAPRLRTGRTVVVQHCQECESWPEQLRWARCAYLMHPPADRIVHQLKYRGWSVLAKQMSVPMALALSPEQRREVDLVTCVPTTATRMRERGYNQAELIAKAVAQALGRDCELLLARASARSTQTTLQPAARGANVAGAFRLRTEVRNRLEDACVLLVDDVMTTGATAIECARTLTAAGVRSVCALTYVRAVDTRRLLGT